MDEVKKKKLIITIFGSAEDVDRIKKFCEEEGLYMGRFLVKTAIRHIEEVAHERIQKQLERFK